MGLIAGADSACRGSLVRGIVIGMTDETAGVLAEQVSYYRKRADEYDVTAYGNVAAASARVERLVTEMGPTGAILEIACGTGMWTAALARRASRLTAIDAAPETTAAARTRVKPANVTFEVADVFSWTTSARFDVAFFSAWLSHMPTNRFDKFWALLRPLLGAEARVLFVDEHIDDRGKET
jgi:2-polyprenyl-3-methyl-5-hydroxy-6-metoxy-1,4-benzoquinol methylase